MILDIHEKSVCILFELSSRTECFLASIKDILIEILLEKRDSPEPFLFNLAHFDREVSFWAAQVSKCTIDGSHCAAQWIRSWTSSGPDSCQIGPRTTAAIVAAFGDPFVQALHVITTSMPFESATDLINHAEYASKGRPVHIVFLASKSHFDEKAMQMLHLLCRKTAGTFRIAYAESNEHQKPRLIEIGPMKRGDTKFNSDSLSISSISPPSPIIEDIQDIRVRPSYCATKSSPVSYSDLIVTVPKIPAQHGEQGTFRLEPSEPAILEQSRQHESSEEKIYEIENIKRRFAEFYWKKRTNQTNPPHQDRSGKSENCELSIDVESHPKMVEFREEIAETKPASSSSPPADSSLSTYSKEETAILSPGKPGGSAERDSPEFNTERTEDAVSDYNTERTADVDSPNTAPVTIYTKAHYSPANRMFVSMKTQHSPAPSSRSPSSWKPPWRPPTARSRTSSSSKLLGVEDRSRAWMDGWLNEWVKRHEPPLDNANITASIRPDSNFDPTVAKETRRDKSVPATLHLTTYTQTPHEEKEMSQEMQAIRELLARNNSLLEGAIQRSTGTKDGRIERSIAGQDSKNGQSERSTQTQATRKTRQEQLEQAVKRKEEIKRQQRDSCYKAMYQKLADETTHRSGVPEDPGDNQTANTNQNGMKLIAKLPDVGKYNSARR